MAKLFRKAPLADSGTNQRTDPSRNPESGPDPPGRGLFVSYGGAEMPRAAPEEV